jgi:hypothetical protein
LILQILLKDFFKNQSLLLLIYTYFTNEKLLALMVNVFDPADKKTAPSVKT